MDSPVAPAPVPSLSYHLPAWLAARGREPGEADAAFAAGVALKALDDVLRGEPVWAGCWRSRQALASAIAALRLMGRSEDEAAVRDAVVLTAVGGDPGPAGNVLRAFRALAGRKGAVTSGFLAELADLLALRRDERLAGIVDHFDAALQSRRAVPFCAAEFVAAVCVELPEAEALAWGLSDGLVAARLKWQRPLPLLMAERYGPAFRTAGGRGRLRPGEDGFERAVCLALVDGAEAALRRAGEISRRAEKLLAVTPKLRTKGGGAVIRKLLEEDAIAASAPGTNLSRWASARLFERLEGFGVVRELSGRGSFRVYGL